MTHAATRSLAEPSRLEGGDAQAAYAEQLRGIRATWRQHYQDMQDFEFTVQQGKLFMLQTRTGKRTATAAVRSPWTWRRKG